MQGRTEWSMEEGEHEMERQIFDEQPSALRCLQLGYSVRECKRGYGGGWAIYLDNGGIQFYPPDEGPQEASSIAEAIEWIGGDQSCWLTRQSEQRLCQLGIGECKRVLAQMKEEPTVVERVQPVIGGARGFLAVIEGNERLEWLEGVARVLGVEVETACGWLLECYIDECLRRKAEMEESK